MNDRQKTAVEQRAHAVAYRRALDRHVVGAVEDQAVDVAARQQQLADRAAAAKPGAAAFGTADRVGQHDICAVCYQPVQPEALNQCRRGGCGLPAGRAQSPHEPLRQHAF